MSRPPQSPADLARVAAGKDGAPGRRRGRRDGRPRTAARVAAVQALYQIEQTDGTVDRVVQEFVRHRLGSPAGTAEVELGRLGEADVALFGRIVRGAEAARAAIDAMIGAALTPDWPLARLDPVLRALLRAACAELQDAEGPPAAVVLNEYLDVAHSFFSGQEPALANGVLHSVAQSLRRGEAGEGAPSPDPPARRRQR